MIVQGWVRSYWSFRWVFLFTATVLLGPSTFAQGEALIGTSRLSGAQSSGTVANSLMSSEWKISADFTAESIGTVPNVYGVNKGPLETERACTPDTEIGARLDYTRLYQTVGVTSVRLHDDAVDLSLIRQGGSFKACQLEQIGVNDRGVPIFEKGNYTCESYEGGACYKTAEDTGAFLAWNTPPALGGSSALDFTLADSSYQSVIDGGFEPYLRIGDSWNGVALYSHPTVVSEVGAAVVEHYSGSALGAGTPRYIELHNEPDGRFWQDTTLKFVEYIQKLEKQVDTTLDRVFSVSSKKNLGLSGNSRTRPAVGCCGFTGAFSQMMDNPDGVAYRSLKSLGQSGVDFVSAHTYSKGAAALPSSPVTALKKFRDGLDAFCAENSWSNCPALHISEWNSSLDGADSPSFFTSQDAAFISLFLSLAIDPSLNIEQAHFYAGSRHGRMGMFFENSDDVESLGRFVVAPSAFGFSLHSGFRGWSLHPIRITQSSSGETYDSALSAAAADQPVVAYAVREGVSGAVALAVTNFSDAPKRVSLAVRIPDSGSPSRGRSVKTYQQSVRSLNWRPVGGIGAVAVKEFVKGELDRSRDVHVPKESEVSGLLSRAITSTSSRVTATAGSGKGVIKTEIELPAYGAAVIQWQALAK